MNKSILEQNKTLKELDDVQNEIYNNSTQKSAEAVSEYRTFLGVGTSAFRF